MTVIDKFTFDSRFLDKVEITLLKVSRKELIKIIRFLDEIEGAKVEAASGDKVDIHSFPKPKRHQTISLEECDGLNSTAKPENKFKLKKSITGGRRRFDRKDIENRIYEFIMEKKATKKEILEIFEGGKPTIISILMEMEKEGKIQSEKLDKIGTKRYILPLSTRPKEAKMPEKTQISIISDNLRAALWDAYESHQKMITIKDFDKYNIMESGTPEEFLRRISEDSAYRESIEKGMGLHLDALQDSLIITGMINAEK